MAKITRFGILKMALFMGIYSAIIGLIGGILFSLISLVNIPISGTGSFGMFGFIFGIGAIIFLPIIYGIFGFLGGLIFTPLVNLILKIIHGIDLDIEMVENQQSQQYSAEQSYNNP